MRIDASPAHDFPAIDPETIARSYVICSTPRCGSTLLARALLGTGKLGVPAEYFNRGAHLPEYMERFGTDNILVLIAEIKRFRTSPNGVFGFKAHFSQFQELLSEISLGDAFPDLKYIFITRQDLLLQSISFVRARQTGAWTAGRPSKADSQFDLHWLIGAMRFIQESNANWERLLAALGVSPLRITYEGLCASPAQAVGSVFDLLGLAEKAAVSLGRVELEVQRDEITEEWVQRFREAFAGLHGSPSAKQAALQGLELAPAQWREFRKKRDRERPA